MRIATTAIGFKGLLLEIHQDAAIRRPSRPLNKKPVCKKPLTRPINIHHADVKLAIRHFGKSDDIAAGRPDRRCIAALVKANALDIGTIGNAKQRTNSRTIGITKCCTIGITNSHCR